jgi:hypothetical protein
MAGEGKGHGKRETSQNVSGDGNIPFADIIRIRIIPYARKRALALLFPLHFP